MKKSIILFLLASMSLTASAQDPVKIDGLWYKLEKYSSYRWATVVRDPNDAGYSGDLVIPETVSYGGEVYEIIAIGERAFCGTDILSAEIKCSSGASIYSHAFSLCKSLSSVTIGEGVTWMNDYVFYGCDNLASVVIDNVSNFGKQTFQNCPSLTSVVLGKSAGWIGTSSFFDCPKLKDIYCYTVYSPYQGGGRIFNDDQLQDLTLHVPEAYYNNYVFNNGDDNYPWQHFGKIETMTSTTLEQCATPKITYAGGNVSFTCETPGVAFNSTVEYVENSFNNTSEFTAPSHFRVRAVALKDGYLPSEVAEQEFALEGIVDPNTGDYKEGDENRDGNVNNSDRLKVTNVIMDK